VPPTIVNVYLISRLCALIAWYSEKAAAILDFSDYAAVKNRFSSGRCGSRGRSHRGTL